jgi:hypothetical protein
VPGADVSLQCVLLYPANWNMARRSQIIIVCHVALPAASHWHYLGPCQTVDPVYALQPNGCYCSIKLATLEVFVVAQKLYCKP